MKIPAKVLEKIQQNQALVIEWAGHRDIYEIVEEWTDALFWLANLWIAAYYAQFIFDFTPEMWLAVTILSIIITIPAWLETEKWISEWHIITHDLQKGGGLYFKSVGILNNQTTPMDIMKTLPVVDEYSDNILYWLWKKLTAHRMQKITIKSDAGLFLLIDNRMPPAFANAWFRVRGPIMTTKPEDGIWNDLEQLYRQMLRDNYPVHRGKQIIQQKIDGHFFQ